jgi:SAM-dependent methyltransferase
MTEPVQNWDPISAWWIEDIASDPLHEEDVRSLLEVLVGQPEGIVADLGCGEGQWLRWLRSLDPGAGPSVRPFGCDLSATLLGRAATAAPVVRCRLPYLGWLRDDSIDAAVSVYVADLFADLDRFFAETARVTVAGGSLTIIVNHPAFTAPGSTPLMDQDGEVVFRWGDYFGEGSSTEPAGDRELRFYHRSTGRLLSAAAAAGWSLHRLEERGLSAATLARYPGYAGQQHIPRILGATWTLRVD